MKISDLQNMSYMVMLDIEIDLTQDGSINKVLTRVFVKINQSHKQI